MANKEYLESALNGQYGTITGLAQQLNSVVYASDFETVYRGRIHEIRRIQKIFAGIRPSKYEKVKVFQIAKKKHKLGEFRTRIDCLGRTHRGTSTLTAKVKDCIYVDQQFFEVEGKVRLNQWQAVMHIVMTFKDEEERVSEQLQATGATQVIDVLRRT